MTVDTCKLNTRASAILKVIIIYFSSYYLLYGGSILISFSLFMLSLTEPDHLWQVRQLIAISLNSITFIVEYRRISLLRVWVSA